MNTPSKINQTPKLKTKTKHNARSDSDGLEELLGRGVAEVIDLSNLMKRLAKGDKLRLKLGIDPTASDIHLGFAVLLRKLRQFQDLGHHVVIIIGDATAQVGDPTGKNVTRPTLSSAEISINAKTYLEQIGKILNLDKTEIRHNSEWFEKLGFAGLIELLGKFTVAQILERDDFSQRLKVGSDVHLHELLYPVMQAYDSVMIQADVEFGGTDQRFNILAGRDLQKKMGQAQQDMLVVPLLVGTDGEKKMSKSLGNYIGITESEDSMYGKLMSIPDSAIIDYFTLATDVPTGAIELIKQELTSSLTNPRDIKMELARSITAMYHSTALATAAEERFINQFQKGQIPTDIPQKKMAGSYKTAIAMLQAGELVTSNAEARRLIEQGGVRLDGKTITESLSPIKLTKGVIIQVGKRRYIKVA